jgi:putative PIN family toxin of toxin-antitoxin system
MRLVLDTNVLIDAATDDFSPQARLIEAAIDGEIVALVTDHTEREYRKILSHLVGDAEHHRLIEDFLTCATRVDPGTCQVQIDDKDDAKFLATAIGGKADAIVTRDRHLLDIGEVGGTRIMTPSECWASLQDDIDNNAWQDWVDGLGI